MYTIGKKQRLSCDTMRPLVKGSIPSIITPYPGPHLPKNHSFQTRWKMMLVLIAAKLPLWRNVEHNLRNKIKI